MPVSIIAIYLFVSAEGGLDRRGPRIVLVVSILTYALFKYLFRPGWLGALPLPRGLPQPLVTSLIFATPVAITGLAGALTWLYARRHSNAGLLRAFILFAGCDLILTLLVYIPGVLAE